MTHGFNDTPLPPGGSHGFTGDYSGRPRLDPISERQLMTTGTAEAMAMRAGAPETIGEGHFREEPTPENYVHKGKFNLGPVEHILLGMDNPDGRRLEALCDQLTRELAGKSEKLEPTCLDHGPRGAAARQMVANNGEIIGLIQRIKAIHLDSIAGFAAIEASTTPAPKTGMDAHA